MLLLSVFLAFLLVIGLMSIGVLINKKSIKGSCGGLNALGLKEDCVICGGSKETSTKSKNNHLSKDALYYDATNHYPK